MKTLVLGDIHGRTCWKDIIDKETPDRVIFLGDYVSTHERNISDKQQCDNLDEILFYKETNPDSVILLRGNHDLQHLGYYWAECSGYFREVGRYMQSIKDRFLENTQWVFVDGNIIFSHAGITNTWFNHSECAFVKDLNVRLPDEFFGFTPDHWGDNYGDSKTQPCTWVRPGSLMADAYNQDEHGISEWTQVVGHTTMKMLVNLKDYDPTSPNIWVCDTLPKQYLVIEDGNFIVKDFEISK